MKLKEIQNKKMKKLKKLEKKITFGAWEFNVGAPTYTW